MATLQEIKDYVNQYIIENTSELVGGQHVNKALNDLIEYFKKGSSGSTIFTIVSNTLEQTITHNKDNKYPDIILTDSNGIKVDDFEVEYVDVNSLKIRFLPSFPGGTLIVKSS